ncbi:lysine-rich nucleolar protein 1 isoform X2 [Ahaetulla prasina]|uniref:lysine-rich nucleolar protein 1 isoform X2 n=1 Tax=Ahaetulla prasina TaxID=499056 RepID=UPI00264779F2|nr:lysine-rich nucleolar protein 1 isoform X2 [Ahaetulla prasina]
MKNSKQTAKKRNKAAVPNCGQVVLIESPKRLCLDLGKKVRPKKLKCLVKGTSSDLPDPKKKQSDSELKMEARANSPVVIESSSDLELLRDTKKRNKAFKKRKKQKLFCIQVENSNGLDEGQPGTIDLHVSKKCNKIVLEVGRQDEGSAMKRKKKKREKRRDKPACLELLHSGDCERPVKQISGELKSSCQEMSSSQKKSKILEQKAVGEEVEKKYFDYYGGDPKNISKQDTASFECKDTQSGDGPMQRQDDLARSEAIKKKKKKKQKKQPLNKISPPPPLSCLAKIQENHCDTMSECSLKCGSEKEARRVGKTLKEIVKAAKEEAKRKPGNVNRFSEAGQDVLSKLGAPGGKEKRKRAKKHNVEQDDRDGLEGSQQQQVKKKRRKKEMENSQDGGKKVKKEKETKKQITEEEIKLVAFRKGNCDEVKIDKVRRQALQEEIDRESGKIKIAKEGSRLHNLA